MVIYKSSKGYNIELLLIEINEIEEQCGPYGVCQIFTHINSFAIKNKTGYVKGYF